nr:RagB/SusD family nutrient uptake outer membrane protein [Proteiniphilum acetatigenes]
MNYTETTSNSKEEVFSSFSRTANFVTDIYGRLDYDFGNYGGAMLASASDEADYAWSNSSIHDFYNGSWSPINPKADIWRQSYAGIRAANFYLEASAGQTFDGNKYDQDYEEQFVRFQRYQYEVRFLRAYFYFNLVRQYGDVPLVTTVLASAEANSVERTPAEQVFDFIIDECDAIVNHLPVRYTNLSDRANNETGRIGRIAVVALKAKTLLYKASPLFNTDNNKNLWRDAALASKAVIDSCSVHGISLGAYTDLWGTENYVAREGIFMRRIGDLNYLEAYNYPIGVEGGNSGNCPTQTLVDAYEMKETGLLWNEPGSGYSDSDPYTGRDPRFAMTIVKNGDEKWPIYNENPIETFVGGRNASPLAGATTTGYYLRKYLDPSVDLRVGNTNSKRHSWIIFRLGEFYLNYAEALFNYLGSPDATDDTFTLSAVDAINVIRNRSGVGMPPFATGMTNEAFLKKYKNERMVELAFEGHRFWDVRRWKEGEVLRSVTRMQITRNPNGTYNYNRVTKQRSWEDKMYFFPIPDSERRINPNLYQNEGW